MTRLTIVGLLIIKYILYCIRFKTMPWRYFQLNAAHFNMEKGIFSKLEMDRVIPRNLRLWQFAVDEGTIPETYPVFVKPEWGQNAHGIHRVDTKKDYLQMRAVLKERSINYLVQQAAQGRLEFEIFYIRHPFQPDRFSVLSITQVCNTGDEAFPINSVRNKKTCYLDRTGDYSLEEKQQLWQMIQAAGDFKIARVAASADSKQDLLKGRFHIIEINIFTPMPLNLLDFRQSWRRKIRFIDTAMSALAVCVKGLAEDFAAKPIFFRKLKMHYRVKSRRWQR